MTTQDALRSPAARKERRTSLLLSAGVMFAGSAAEPLYRALDVPLLSVRALWCASLVAIALALPRASSRLYGWLLPLAGVGSCWLFAATVWINGGIASPDFQYMVLLPLALMVVFQDEVIACAAVVAGTVSAVAVLSWLGHAPVSAAADSLATDLGIGVLTVFGAFSFRRVRIAELATQHARADALERLARSEHRRAQAERLAALGQLAAGVAHEINNPLCAVSANVELLAGEAGLQCAGLSASETRVLVADLQHGVGRIAQIVRDLKEFSSGGSDQLQPCQVDEVIGDALRLAAFKLGKVVEVRRSFDRDLPPVIANRRKLSQVLLNLLVNAAEAMEEARTEKPWVLVTAEHAGDAVQIAVQDNGPGISGEVAARLFEPFVTSKPLEKGTGLGLALSREYVTSFGGTLELEPIAGPGARFAIQLTTTLLS
ncbi:MAG TPA: ATP-binding protein [Kofleriaceae bacterium]|jgi:C4-dicarboxylate-specific signal transduction histidine kinase